MAVSLHFDLMISIFQLLLLFSKQYRRIISISRALFCIWLVRLLSIIYRMLIYSFKFAIATINVTTAITSLLDELVMIHVLERNRTITSHESFKLRYMPSVYTMRYFDAKKDSTRISHWALNLYPYIPWLL